ncbi:hypothetical protein VCHA47P369_50168 [Vibrio chagasii]|nr:hypothetical protein VCHA48P435_30221 [Vibrio chagasii]CAH7245002.1 hypothetical protein VCHA47P369_50168 [Vibrio chagasii]CAH7285835.1 hypothetical protein VCHA51O448_40168 [Vibrio chagasii]
MSFVHYNIILGDNKIIDVKQYVGGK